VLTAPQSQERETKAVSAADAARRKAIFSGGGLYAPRQPVHPKLVHGRWRQVKWAMLVLTLGIYYGAPWLRWERPGELPDQAILVDFTHGRFYFFFIQLWPQEVYFITGLLVLAALALFLATALFGRLWCGYSCPQTIWTDLYILVERTFEGDRNARLKLQAAPWGWDKAWRKVGKHSVWLIVAFWTGGAWTLYFHDAPTLVRQFWAGAAPLSVYVSFAVLTFTTYALAGLMREQVCTYMCPWPRIQGALVDEHTLQVTYRRDRGEPRAPHKKAESWEGRGDCIDCRQCVIVCPMGIDIRDGLQLECINCGLCADACDEIMLKVDRPRGLIAYDTGAAVSARAAKGAARYRLVRPRTIFYALLLAAVATIVVAGLATRDPFVLSVIRDRNPTHVNLSDGSTRDGYTLKVSNRTFAPQRFTVRFEGVPGARLSSPSERSASDHVIVEVPADQIRTTRIFVTAPPAEDREPITEAAFVVEAGGRIVRDETTFVSGASR